MKAWAKVDAYYYDDRPKEIFLVVGQELTPTYATSHKKNDSIECEVMLKANVGIPSVVEGTALASYGITKAYAGVGFENVVATSTEGDPTQYTVFLHPYRSKSRPIQRVKLLKTRIEEAYR
jgi:hypothetical protein